MSLSKITDLQDALAYSFKDTILIERALSHPSYAAENNCASYERLEFLGDAVLDLVISEMLHAYYPDEPEGGLAKRRSALVCGETLSRVAREVGVDKAIKISSGEETNGGRENDANLENTLEAIFAAIYLDGGLPAAQKVINQLFETLMEDMIEPPKDPKTALQEWAQGRGLPIPEYELVAQTGPAHSPQFTMRVVVKGEASVEAEGGSKREAERKAAADLLERVADE